MMVRELPLQPHTRLPDLDVEKYIYEVKIYHHVVC